MVLVSDLHLGKIQDTIEKHGMPSRLFDTQMRLYEAINYAVKKKSVLVIAGDVFNYHSPNPEYIAVLFSILDYAQYKDVKVYIIPGNHDCSNTFHSIQYLSKELDKQNKAFKNTVIITNPWFENIENMNVVFLPHIPRAYMSVENYQKNALLSIQSQKKNKSIDLVIGHAHLTGAKNSSEVKIEMGNKIHFNPSNFFKYKLGVFGHIHKHQIIKNNIYIGPVCTNSFDEAPLIKGFIYVKTPLEWRFIPYKTKETEYKQVFIDLISKDKVLFDSEKMKRVVENKLLKITVYTDDLMKVNQTEIKNQFSKYGTICRFEVITDSDKYRGDIDDSINDDFMESVNYKPVFKSWVKDKKFSKEKEKLVLQLGNNIIEEVLNDKGN